MDGKTPTCSAYPRSLLSAVSDAGVDAAVLDAPVLDAPVLDVPVLDAPVGGFVDDVGFATVLDEALVGFVAADLVGDEDFGAAGLVGEEVDAGFFAVLVFVVVAVVFAVVVDFVVAGFVVLAVSRRTADCPADCAGLRTCERTVSLVVEAPVFGVAAEASGKLQFLIPAMESWVAVSSGERG